MWLKTQSRKARRPCSRVEEMSPTPLCSRAATRPFVALLVEVQCAGSRRLPSEGGVSSSSNSLCLHALGGPRRCLERARDRLPERLHTEELQRDPDLQCPRRAGQLEPEVGEVDLLLVGLGVAEVVGQHLERGPQRPPVAHEHAAALERLVEPLVRVERDRVRKLDPGQQGAICEGREAAVGPVHVQPHAALAAGLGKLGQRVDRARVGRPGVRGQEERRAAGRDVGTHRRRAAWPGRA